MRYFKNLFYKNSTQTVAYERNWFFSKTASRQPFEHIARSFMKVHFLLCPFFKNAGCVI